MKRFLWPPSPAAVIACVALFVALGGGAYAAVTITSADVRNNSLLSKDLKDGKGVKGADVKNNSLSSKDLKDGKGVKGIDVVNNSLTGEDINESSLGEVPVANRLDGLRVVIPFVLTDGQSSVMLTHGPFTVTATCEINEAGNDIARILITTSQDNSSMDAWDEEDDFDAADTDLDFGPPVIAPTGTTEVEASNVAGGVAIAPLEVVGSEGHNFQQPTIYILAAYSAVNAPFVPQGFAGSCVFSGSFLTLLL